MYSVPDLCTMVESLRRVEPGSAVTFRMREDGDGTFFRAKVTDVLPSGAVLLDVPFYVGKSYSLGNARSIVAGMDEICIP